jgi:LacI family transcriptional regulator
MVQNAVVERRVTLVQVAERAGVSRTTAGYVLAGRDQEMRIAEETRHRVLRAATEMNYRPNLMARSLRSKSARPFALISDTIATEPYAGQMIHGAMAAAAKHGRLLLIGETRRDPTIETHVVDEFLGTQIDGFIYATVYPREVKIPPVLRDTHLVTLNCASDDDKVPRVMADQVGAGRTAARTLLNARHRDGIYLVGDLASDRYAPGRERLAGIAEVLSAAGTRLAGSVDCAWEAESSHDAVERMLRTAARPTALICLNDRIAFGAYQALKEAGLAIPRDVSVVSFEESELASWLRPELTSIAVPHYQMGWRAVELLLAGHLPDGIEQLAMPLRERSSVAPPAHQPARRHGD